MENNATSAALTATPAHPDAAVTFFEGRLSFQADISDVRASLLSGHAGFAPIDCRGVAGRRQAHIPGALHLPTADIPARVATVPRPALPVITYCWGPGRDGASRAALAPARLGYRVWR
ncbi:rhodanese-like domain-containing protein [Streptomyces sp. NPDC006617]|uniref:rhodanese-like domain-containing protein n=1 Tax=Streptomyces sp. NPDC006617 TaxID=3155354 RepID=UPI0033B3C56C